jgi:hypothetical protein
MSGLKLSTLAVVLGLAYGLAHVYGVVKPRAFGQALRRFPRFTPVGYPLMLAATAWFLYNLSLENVSDFTRMKPVMYLVFAAVGVGACLFVRDFLPVRGLAVLLLLLAKLAVDTARWEDTAWRLVITTWAYLWIIAGMWLTVSPWRLRDIFDWVAASDQRVRLFSAARLAFGVFVVILGLTVYRTAEAREAAATQQGVSASAR